MRTSPSIAFLSSVALWVAFTLTSANAAEPKCEITNYGIIGNESGMSRLPTPQTVTGRYTVIDKGDIVERTSIIPARLGMHFGVTRTLSNFPDGAKADLVISHPDIVKPNGEHLARSVIPARPGAFANGYTLDSEYEVVPGTWQFEFFYGGKSLCRHSFELIAPLSPR